MNYFMAYIGGFFFGFIVASPATHRLLVRLLWRGSKPISRAEARRTLPWTVLCECEHTAETHTARRVEGLNTVLWTCVVNGEPCPRECKHFNPAYFVQPEERE